MDPTQFINALCDGKTLADQKHNHFIYLSILPKNGKIGDQTNFITAAAIVAFESDAYAINPQMKNKVDIFCNGTKIMTVDTDDFEVNA